MQCEKFPDLIASASVTAGLMCASGLPQAMAVKMPHITANAQPAVITIQPEFSALDFFRRTARDYSVAEENEHERAHKLAKPGRKHAVFLSQERKHEGYKDSVKEATSPVTKTA